jgi:predicted membrane chloride channel (bestrophin family)
MAYLTLAVEPCSWIALQPIPFGLSLLNHTTVYSFWTLAEFLWLFDHTLLPLNAHSWIALRTL